MFRNKTWFHILLAGLMIVAVSVGAVGCKTAHGTTCHHYHVSSYHHVKHCYNY